MRTVDILQKKRDGGELSREEIEALIRGLTDGSVPDYQVAAWAMAVYFQGMTDRETADLTMAMAESGDQVDLSVIPGIKVDKHSTGGVGDTTTLVLAPLVAAAGAPVAKMSGRGLGHTGGTIDKLESIPGFSTELDRNAFIRQVREIGVAIAGQTDQIAPADKKLYALRDVTATVNSIPLIASSVMSKKIAAGADAIVLDVKTGSGAFMKTPEDSIRLAETMVRIGTLVGRETRAIISSMDQPLGFAVGNALEVREAIDTLKGKGPRDLRELCMVLGAQMLVAAGKAENEEKARAMLKDIMESGKALDKLKQLAAAQGGDPDVIDHPEKLPTAGKRRVIRAENTGWIASIEAESIGRSAMMLGAGRDRKEEDIDLAAGIMLKKKAGDRVEAGEPLAELHYEANREERARDVSEIVKRAFRLSDRRPEEKPFLYALVTKDGRTPL